MQKILHISLIVIISILTILRMFSGLTYQPIEKWDEQTNIAVVTNSLENHSFPVLYLDNKPFFEKPPLWYLIAAATPNPRLISVVSGIGIILLTVFLAYTWWGVIAGIATWIVLLGTNQLFTVNAGGYFSSHTLRTADLDAMQLLCIIIAFAASVHRMPIIAGITAGLAILTKGPLGIIPLFLANSKKAWVVCIFTITPWYLFMILKFGLPFISAHFGYHVLSRTLVPIEGHNPPPWYYLQLISNHSVFFSWELLTGSLVWTLLKKTYYDRKILFTLVLMIIFFIIPTLVRTRLSWYMLPFYPFAALLIGAAVANVVKQIIKTLDR